MPQPGDQELIEGCLAQDAASWNLFVERFSRLVHWSIRQSLDFDPPGGKEEFCREVFQDFFRRLMEKNELSKLRRAENVRKFLVVSAAHLSLDRIKSLSRDAKKNRSLDEWMAGGETVLPESGALLTADTAALEEELSGILSRLSPKERACIDFYWVQGKTSQQTGLLLGMGAEAVRSLVQRTKEKLKQRLAQKGFDKNI